MPAWEAGTAGCEKSERMNLRAGPIIPEAYCVYLLPGVTPKEHIQTIGIHTGSNLASMDVAYRSDEFSDDLAVSYCAKSPDAGTLAAIRADIAVDVVVCSRDDPPLAGNENYEDIVPLSCGPLPGLGTLDGNASMYAQ
ncbi:hypothetical protein TI39_contig296g00002 [Zymoseptoria brevis]|uniref:Uncharacterized protein n=1 Tax=Zymoseptoria brevis TaxID=1047168 RepID=A0A0F4GW96_9PEZI|nr:hypothetical protein TI39_contig296g00002 [Zymoseptoria brevis]